MPYVLKEIATGRLLAAMQVNGYQLPYYGVILWENAPSEPEAEEALARAGIGSENAGNWEAAELDGHQAKMANVKLRNDAGRSVLLRDNALIAVEKASP